MDEPVKQTIEQCETCKYVRIRTYGTTDVLECRYSDPFTQGQKGYWPEVQTTDWCGKWETISPATLEMEPLSADPAAGNEVHSGT